MKEIKPPRVEIFPAIPPGTLHPTNLLQDLVELAVLLLPEVERAVAPLSEERFSESADGAGEDEGRLLQAQEDHALNAFLLAVAVNQVVEDYLHRDLFSLEKVAKNLRMLLPKAVGKPAATGVRSLGRFLFTLRAFLPGERWIRRHYRVLPDVIQQLARYVANAVDKDPGGPKQSPDASSQEDQIGHELRRAARDILAATLSAPKSLRRDVMRLPACFRSFAQCPADCLRIIQKFAERWPERSTPLVVVGVRTSGSYLAPLYAAFLRMSGYQQVQAFTFRPGDRWLPGERDWLLKHLRPGGRVLLVDDPPVTGHSIVQTARALERIGVPRQSISVVVQFFGAQSDFPSALNQYDVVSLFWDEWDIHRRLANPAVEKALAELLTGRTMRVTSRQGAQVEIVVAGVRVAERLPLIPDVHHLGLPWSPPVAELLNLQPFRGHVRGLYRVRLLDESTNEWFEHTIYAKGVGLGYFGTHSLMLAQALASFLPAIYGLRDGLLYRAWLPEEEQLSGLPSVDRDALANQMAAYTAAHQRLLGLPEDTTGRLIGRHTLWQRGNEDIAAHAFGFATSLVRPALLQMAKYLLLRPVRYPAVIDGSMAPPNWFLSSAAVHEQADSAPALLKVEFDTRVFSNQNLDCYDLFYDLASAAAYYELHTGDGTFSDLLRQQYARLTGDSCSDERWLMYQLIALQLECGNLSKVFKPLLWEGTDGTTSDTQQRLESRAERPYQALQALEAGQRTISRVQERYYGKLFFEDVTPSSAGPLCAIDLDGVLETGWLPSVSITPAGALSLRALARHGYRPVIATGRSVDQVRERCQSYRLAGGMAEYGSVLYNHLTGETRVLLSASEQADLDALRAVLQQMEGVFVSPAHTYSVRAYQVRKDGLCALKPDVIEQALQQVPGRERLRPIQGVAQTDFMVAGIDKGTGLTALAAWLGGAADRPPDSPLLTFAAGDTVSDLAMFKRAKHAFAPANADSAVRVAAQTQGTHIRIMKRPYQAGLLEAVSHLLEHDPRRCSLCRPPACSTETRLFLTMVGARDTQRWGKLKQGMLLAWRLAQTH